MADVKMPSGVKLPLCGLQARGIGAKCQSGLVALVRPQNIGITAGKRSRSQNLRQISRPLSMNIAVVFSCGFPCSNDRYREVLATQSKCCSLERTLVWARHESVVR